jgi:hypothetical protein
MMTATANSPSNRSPHWRDLPGRRTIFRSRCIWTSACPRSTSWNDTACEPRNSAPACSSIAPKNQETLLRSRRPSRAPLLHPHRLGVDERTLMSEPRRGRRHDRTSVRCRLCRRARVRNQSEQSMRIGVSGALGDASIGRCCGWRSEVGRLALHLLGSGAAEDLAVRDDEPAVVRRGPLPPAPRDAVQIPLGGHARDQQLPGQI